MAKYNFEFKMTIVKEYLDGQGSFEHLGKKYHLDKTVIRRWVANYKRFGEKGLMRCKQKSVYTFEFKLRVVELYLSSELSYFDIALKFGIPTQTLIARWVIDYRTYGPDALKPKRKGRKRTMDKEKIIREIEESDPDEQKELLKQLQEENLHLRIENAFLKEARRLRLEEEGLLNELRESSTASEENTN